MADLHKATLRRLRAAEGHYQPGTWKLVVRHEWNPGPSWTDVEYYWADQWGPALRRAVELVGLRP